MQRIEEEGKSSNFKFKKGKFSLRKVLVLLGKSLIILEINF